MEKLYIENQKFDRVDYSNEQIIIGEYEKCIFLNCNFSNVDLSDITFTQCTFNNCNLSLAHLKNTAFRNINFENCKLFGLHFQNCNHFLLSFNFNSCQLNLSSFYKLKIKGTKFINCNLNEVDFTETDLNTSLFDNCDLNQATFEATNIEKCDFRSSFNYSINLEKNKYKKARFSEQGLIGLLHHYDIDIVS